MTKLTVEEKCKRLIDGMGVHKKTEEFCKEWYNRFKQLNVRIEEDDDIKYEDKNGITYEIF